MSGILLTLRVIIKIENFHIFQDCAEFEKKAFLYATCDCIRRHGLQDECRLRVCRRNARYCFCGSNPICCASTIAKKYANMTMGVPSVKEEPRLKRHQDQDYVTACSGICYQGCLWWSRKESNPAEWWLGK